MTKHSSTGLSDIMRDFKKFTSAEIIRAIENNSKESRKNWMLWIFSKAGENNARNINYQFWQQDNHPVECSTPQIFDSKINYLHENPVRAGLVWNAEDYRYSSAVDYYTTRKGLIEIDRKYELKNSFLFKILRDAALNSKDRDGTLTESIILSSNKQAMKNNFVFNLLQIIFTLVGAGMLLAGYFSSPGSEDETF